MAKRKPKPEITAKCYLCDFFYHSPLVKDGQIHNPRQCVRTGTEIHSIDPICESFAIAPYFFCDRSSHQISPAMCHKRWSTKFESCNSKCHQRGELLKVSEPPPVSILKTRAGASATVIILPPEEIQEPITLKTRCHVTL